MISCMKDGKVWYINRLSDFEEVVEPSVYEALKQYIGEDAADERPGDVIARLEGRIYDLQSENETLEDDNRELDWKNDDLEEENEKLIKKNELLKEKVEKIRQAAGMAKEISETMQAIAEELEDE